MTETKNETIDVSSVINEPTLQNRNVVSTIAKVRRERTIKFHAYDKEKNCRKFNKEHKYVKRSTYFKCTRCGSSKTIKPTKSKEVKSN
jgi:hypothetical protein